jgi:hypothetical protein
MNRPNLHNIIETFIPIEIGPNDIGTWNSYINILRQKVSPLIEILKKKNLISWYSFLVHGNKHISEDYRGPSECYVHLRLEIQEGVREEQLIENIPEYYIETRRMQVSDPPTLDNVVSCPS